MSAWSPVKVMEKMALCPDTRRFSVKVRGTDLHALLCRQAARLFCEDLFQPVSRHDERV